MPSTEYQFIVNGRVAHTVYTKRQKDKLESNMKRFNMNYEIKEISLVA